MSTQPLRALALLAAFACLASTAAAADIDFVNQFRNVGYRQTSDTSLADNGAFFSASAVVTDAAIGAYASATLRFGVPAAPTLLGLASSDGGKTFLFQTGSFNSQADMDAAFPTGTAYTFMLEPTDPAAATASTTLDVGGPAYAALRPQLTMGSFSALQGMNAAAPLALHFSPFVPDSAATDAFMFLSIQDHDTGGTVFPLFFAPATTIGVTLAGGLLAAGHSFTFELIYSDRVLTAHDSSANFDGQSAFDLRTVGDFSTAAAVPEPQAWALLLAGLAGLGAAWGLRRRSLHGAG